MGKVVEIFLMMPHTTNCLSRERNLFAPYEVSVVNIVRKHFYQSPEDEEDHEETPESGFCINIPVTNSGHGHHEQIDTFPVGKSLVVLEIFPWVP